MQQEEDYILREIQRLSLFLGKLIQRIAGLEGGELSIELQKVETDLKGEFGFTLAEIAKMTKMQLTETLGQLHEIHLEKIVEMISFSLENFNEEDRTALARKGIILLNQIEQNSITFSIHRMNLKNSLQTKG